MDNGSAKNLRFNDVTRSRNWTAFQTECVEYLSSDRYTNTMAARKNLRFDDVTQWRKFTTYKTEFGENVSSVR